MQKKRLLLTFFACLAAIVLLVGCNTLDSVLKEGGNSAPLAQILDKIQNEKTEGDATSVVTNVQQGESTVRLYFANSEGKGLIEVSRSIPKTLSLARETVNQWLMGPSGGTDTFPAVDPQTILLDINIKNGVATVDFSREFGQSYSNVSPEITLYGLVNTLTQFSTVQIVKIRVEGQEINDFQGIDLSNLRSRDDLIGGSTGPAASQQNAADQPAQDQDVLVESPSSINLFTN